MAMDGDAAVRQGVPGGMVERMGLQESIVLVSPGQSAPSSLPIAAPVDDGWVANPSINKDGIMMEGTEAMWSRDPTKPLPPSFNAAYAEEYDLSYSH